MRRILAHLWMQLTGRPNSVASSFVLMYVRLLILPEDSSTKFIDQEMGQDNGSTMALSKRKTTVAVLRSILGSIHGQEDKFAKLAERSRSWVKKVSAGQEVLVDDAARVLELNVGISLAWLKGNPNFPPVSSTGRPFNFKFFENYRAKLREGIYPRITVVRFTRTISKIAGIGAAAGRKGKASLFHWRLSQFLEKCSVDFGFDESTGRKLERSLEKANVSGMSFQDRWIDFDTGVDGTSNEGEYPDDEIKKLLKLGGDTRNAK